MPTTAHAPIRTNAPGRVVSRVLDLRALVSTVHRTRVSEMRVAASRRAVPCPIVEGAGRRDEQRRSERHGRTPRSLAAD